MVASSAPGRSTPAVHLRVGGRVDSEGPRGRPHRQRRRRDRGRVNADGHRECSASTWSPAKTAPAGWRSCAASSLEGSAARAGHLRRPRGPTPCHRLALVGAAWQRCRTHFMRNLLTKVPNAAADRRHARPHDLRAARPAQVSAARPRRRPARRALPTPRPMLADADDILAFAASHGALAPDLLEQPPGAAQQGTPTPHRRRRHLPEPRRRHPPRRRSARRATRRVGRRPPLHERRAPRQARLQIVAGDLEEVTAHALSEVM